MTFVFFLLALISLALTFNVRRPIMHHPRWMVYSFLLGWLVGELALHVILVQVLIVSLFIWFGSVSGFWDGISFILFVASWVGLAYHYFSGYEARAVMLQVTLPHRNPDQNHTWAIERGIPLSRLLRPFKALQDEDLIVDKNIVYKEVDGMRLKLDIRRNSTTLKNAPVLMQIHGGAWTYGYGSKNEQGLPLMQALSRAGWVCVAVDYRLSPKATFPDHIIDCKEALVWIKEHIAEYGGNPDFIVATGQSAGGHLSSLLALSDQEKAFQPGFEDKDTRVQGCVPFYGIYDLMDTFKHQNSVGLEIVLRKSIIKERKSENPELYKQMSPINHLNEGAPPFLVVHGDRDSLTSLAEAEFFTSELDSVSKQSVEFAEIPGAQHAFEMFPCLRGDFVVAGVAERLEQWHHDYQTKNQ